MYIKVRESFCTRVIIWIDTILKHIDIREILPRYEGYSHGISRIQVYVDLCVNFEHFQPPISTNTRSQKYVQIWWSANMKYKHFKLWLLCCCFWCCRMMFLSPQKHFPHYIQQVVCWNTLKMSVLKIKILSHVHITLLVTKRRRSEILITNTMLV